MAINDAFTIYARGDQSGEALGVAEDGGLRIRLTGGREEIARVGEIRFAAD